MPRYICTNCNYRFSSEKGASECGYCGKNSIEIEKSANELLDDVDRMLSEWINNFVGIAKGFFIDNAQNK